MSKISVIGGGPAGTASAIRLARTGAQVALYEKSHFPRPKLCGGFLGAEALAELEDLGVLSALESAGVHPLYRTVIASCQGTTVECPLENKALSVSRYSLDDVLLEAARASGVQIHTGVDGFRESHPSDMTVIATGRKMTPETHRSLSLTPWYASPSTVYVGLQASFTGVQGITDQVELDLVESGYVGLARQADGTVNVCTLTTQEAVGRYGPSLDRVLQHFISENPVLRDHLSVAERKSEWMAVGPVRLGVRTLAHESTFYVGDAACVVDPFAGEGMAIGLYSSRLLVQALASASPAQTYARLWRQAFMPALRWNACVRMFYSLRLFREPVLRMLREFPHGLHWIMDLTRYESIA